MKGSDDFVFGARAVLVVGVERSPEVVDVTEGEGREARSHERFGALRFALAAVKRPATGGVGEARGARARLRHASMISPLGGGGPGSEARRAPTVIALSRHPEAWTAPRTWSRISAQLQFRTLTISSHWSLSSNCLAPRHVHRLGDAVRVENDDVSVLELATQAIDGVTLLTSRRAPSQVPGEADAVGRPVRVPHHDDVLVRSGEDHPGRQCV